jgi:hypothetical protein
VFNSAAGSQLNAILGWIKHPDTLAPEAVAQVVAEDFTAQAMRPATLATVYERGPLRVRRPDGALEQTTRYTGRDGFAELVGHLVALIAHDDHPYAKFKLYRIERDGETVRSEQYFSLAGHTDDGRVEEHAVWSATWRWTGIDSKPILTALRVTDYEQVAMVGDADAALYSDCTVSVLGDNPSYESHILKGINYWLDRLERVMNTDIFALSGVIVGDVNGDHLDDMFMPQTGGLPNRLFIQNPDGTATDVSAEAGVDFLDRTDGALFVDLDNDGDQDLVQALTSVTVLMANDGQGHFEVMAAKPATNAYDMVTAVDYDNDGDLDLYALQYSATADEGHRGIPIPFHDANNGGPNALWRNDGNWQFVDVTDEVGLGENNSRFSMACAWEDIDNDGDMDLYVANDYGRNNLYRNDGSVFTDIAAQAGVEDIAAGMSVSFADVNHDGLMDIHVSNMFSSAGNRITYQRQFKSDAADPTVGEYQRHARGNTLFINNGDGSFSDASIEAGITMGRWAWSSLLADINNDSFDDIVVANGYVTGYQADDL